MKRLVLAKDDVFLILSVLMILTYSLLSERLTSDSFDYLRLATFSDTNQLCTLNGRLYGVFACGYSILIQLTSLIFSTDLFSSSKLLNALILVIYYCIFSHIFSSKRLALVLTLLPFNVFVSTYTWSENAILLSFSLYCLALFRIESKNNLDIISSTIAFISILVGCLSRYAFAPFSVFIFLASFIIIQRKALLLLPLFILNAIIFILYRYFISFYDVTRISSREDIYFLISTFLSFCAIYFKKHLLAFSPVIILNIEKLSLYKLNGILKSNWGIFFILLGVSYLALSFILRVMINYDIYNTRTVGLGVSLIAGGVLISYRNIITKSNFIAIILSIYLCQAVLQTVSYRGDPKSVIMGIYKMLNKIPFEQFF